MKFKKKLKKISYKFTGLLLAISIFICGCTPIKNTENKNINDEQISFTGLDDSQLQEYVIENLYSTVNSEFTNDDYTIEEISAVYVSKEYIEESEYNAKSNIYFGYTLDEIEKRFEGKKYVFTVGDDKQTTVIEFKKYENQYKKMLKSVAIGIGVIIVCTTVSLATGGTVSVVFAASAKTATEFALTSAAFSGFISTAIEQYKTGDFNKALEKGGLDASESFKWGAILGGATGGITEYIKQIKAAKNLKTLTNNERGALSEARAQKKFGGKEQVSYLNGKEVPTTTSGATRPDLVREVNGKLEAIEVKNYYLNDSSRRDALYNELNRQVSNRVNNLPVGSTQIIVIDAQGRNYSKSLIEEVINGIKESCGDVYPNIPVEIMY
ncbi:MAG: hypothetical protein K2J20_01860 [Bacilli bacterium]|nr:hypothetical protein [Bacilli bacterium]